MYRTSKLEWFYNKGFMITDLQRECLEGALNKQDFVNVFPFIIRYELSLESIMPLKNRNFVRI